MRNLRRQAIASVAFIIFLLIFTFQNCSQVSFQGFLPALPSSSDTENNGGGYSGRTNSDFYRFTPDFTCEEKQAAVSHLNIQRSTATLTENKKLLCNATTDSFDANLIDYSIYQDDIVGYQEGIFEGSSVTPTSIPSNLVEVWCRDKTDDSGIETITHFDHDTSLAVNRIYYSSGSPQLIPDFSVARTVSAFTITVKDQSGFELVVHRDQPAEEVGLFKGELKAKLNGANISRETSCRLGGSLDPKVWPAKQIVDVDSELFKVSADNTRIAFSSHTMTGIPNLYTSSLDGSQQAQIGPNMIQVGMAAGYNDYHFTPDSRSIIFTGDARIGGIFELFEASVTGANLVSLVSGFTNSTQNIVAPFKTNSIASVFASNQGDTVQSTSLSSLYTTVISPVIFGKFVIAGPVITARKAIYIYGDYLHSELYSTDFDGANLRMITPALPNGYVIDNFDQQLEISPDEKYVALRLANAQSSVSYQYKLVAVDGSGSFDVPAQNTINGFSRDSKFAILHGSAFTLYGEALTVLNMVDGSVFDTPAIPGIKFGPNPKQILESVFFSRDSSKLITPTMIGPSFLSRATAINLSNGNQTDICSGIQAPMINIQELASNDYLLVMADMSTSIVSVYRSTQGVCRKVNSAVVNGPNLNLLYSVSVSNDQQKILVHFGHMFANNADVDANDGLTKWITDSDQLIYIPLSGAPSVLVNAPVSSAAGISYSGFLNNSNQVIYRGDQIVPGENNVFLWNLPQ